MEYWFVMWDYATREFIAVKPKNDMITNIQYAKSEYEPLGYKIITGPFDSEQLALDYIEELE